MVLIHSSLLVLNIVQLINSMKKVFIQILITFHFMNNVSVLTFKIQRSSIILKIVTLIIQIEHLFRQKYNYVMITKDTIILSNVKMKLQYRKCLIIWSSLYIIYRILQICRILKTMVIVHYKLANNFIHSFNLAKILIEI